MSSTNSNDNNQTTNLFPFSTSVTSNNFTGLSTTNTNETHPQSNPFQNILKIKAPSDPFTNGNPFKDLAKVQASVNLFFPKKQQTNPSFTIKPNQKEQKSLTTNLPKLSASPFLPCQTQQQKRIEKIQLQNRQLIMKVQQLSSSLQNIQKLYQKFFQNEQSTKSQIQILKNQINTLKNTIQNQPKNQINKNNQQQINKNQNLSNKINNNFQKFKNYEPNSEQNQINSSSKPNPILKENNSLFSYPNNKINPDSNQKHKNNNFQINLNRGSANRMDQSAVFSNNHSFKQFTQRDGYEIQESISTGIPALFSVSNQFGQIIMIDNKDFRINPQESIEKYFKINQNVVKVTSQMQQKAYKIKLITYNFMNSKDISPSQKDAFETHTKQQVAKDKLIFEYWNRETGDLYLLTK